MLVATALCPWTAHQCAQTLCFLLRWMREAVVEVAVNLNHELMTSFWLHKVTRTPKSEPNSVGITVWGYWHMPMDSISMCSNTLYMSKMDAVSSLSWLSEHFVCAWLGCDNHSGLVHGLTHCILAWFMPGYNSGSGSKPTFKDLIKQMWW